ncbi:hypothetical protein GUITHDRAFT_147129 [Guillardia theta CCMP2712]|uniref:Uncharacterized protein n=2 Tax=Guillardia theta TaxID=55529 RepID=L1IEB3_GUITC|nr:hypothetical protein GUITHDRAFT_147129 [Guillardia theta CCMP2712]EKX34611.1 hypothetical protein GUITHDRAFT_147129 [Guillardia theta CCMP2712]|eukprot:XP_005821591.1 hypothetical protein GUITHDRAFT_147129 [Guillardia theta CCMP2712]
MEHLLLLSRLVGLILDRQADSSNGMEEALEEACTRHDLSMLSVGCEAGLDVRVSGGHDDDNKDHKEDCSDEESEAWVLFSSLIRFEVDCRSHERGEEAGRQYLQGVRDLFMNKPCFLKFLRLVKQLMVSVFVPSPLISYCQDLIKTDVEDQLREEAEAAMSSFIEGVMANDGTDAYHPNDANPCGDEKQDGARILRERKLARLAQSALEKSSSTNPFGDSFNIVHALIPGICSCAHSCVPNALVEAAYDEQGRNLIRVVALRDIGDDEAISISFIDHNQPINERTAAYRERFGLKFCPCMRCNYERGSVTDLNVSQLRALGDLAMQQHRYQDAYELYGNILALHPNEPEALFARGGALLEAGLWVHAHQAFREAALLAPGHERLTALHLKEMAYSLEVGSDPEKWGDEREHGKQSCPRFHPVVEGRAFVTYGEHPVVPLAECQLAVDMAEAAASRRGWDHCSLFNMRHLPVHRDQSTHSFTIALNARSCYEGGLGTAIKPEQGHVLSFEGDMLHGGEPITSGVRYILAAFTYIDVPSPERSTFSVTSSDWPDSSPHSRNKRTRDEQAQDSRMPRAKIDWLGESNTEASFSFNFS